MSNSKQIFNWYEYKINKQNSLRSFSVYRRFRNGDSTPYPATAQLYYFIELIIQPDAFYFEIIDKRWMDDVEDQCHKKSFNVFISYQDAADTVVKITNDFMKNKPKDFEEVAGGLINDSEKFKYYLKTIKSK